MPNPLFVLIIQICVATRLVSLQYPQTSCLEHFRAIPNVVVGGSLSLPAINWRSGSLARGSPPRFGIFRFQDASVSENQYAGRASETGTNFIHLNDLDA